MPKKLVHPRAILDKGYPFEEEEKAVMIQVALSKEQIDELVTISREIRRVNESKLSTCLGLSKVCNRLTYWILYSPNCTHFSVTRTHGTA